VELHFDAAEGVLEGLKLIGFAIWERRSGGGRNVTFPAMQYSVRDGLLPPANHLRHEGGVAVNAAIYARVSTSNGSQTCENQLLELCRYCDARGWTVYTEYTDEISGVKDRRPGLDRLLLEARRARFQVVVCWALDRIGRDLKHLLGVLEDLQSLNIPFVSLKEGLDLGSASGRLQLAILAALSQFERERLKERTLAGLARARMQGKRLGRPAEPVAVGKLEAVKGISVREGAKRLRVARSTLQRWRALARQNPSVAV
jgi:DNA invertase Pin-like site-specific DNA recombinase